MKIGGGAGNRIEGAESEAHHPGAIDAILGGAIPSETTDHDRRNPTGDDSGTIRKTPRSGLINALALAVRDGAEGGDTALVKIATRALADLADVSSTDGATVIDLRKVRGARSPRES